MENGFSSPRTDAFPAGLRVLVVDDDPTWLKILEKMLKKCSYEVTTCCLARDALDMLRGKKDGFDIVISDVNMPDMDGFKLLEQVGLEMDLPVIMMSVDGETSRVMKGVQHGACDYLLKPVRMKELRNIWQHVFRKKIHEVKDIESHEGGPDEFDDGHLLSAGDTNLAKKRKDLENREHDDQEFSDPSAAKKVRVVWSVDLHQKFVNAVNQIGLDSEYQPGFLFNTLICIFIHKNISYFILCPSGDIWLSYLLFTTFSCHLNNACIEPLCVILLAEVGPKKILDLMNVPWLTRENVASHLQKYRLYLSRLQKQNEPKTSFGGIKLPDFSYKDPPGSFGLQSSTTMHQNNAANTNFGYSGNKILVQDVGSQIHGGDLEGIVSFLPAAEPKKALIGDVPDPQKTSSSSLMGTTHSLESLRPDVNYASFEFTIPRQHSWSGETPVKEQLKQEHEPYLLLGDGYTNPPLPIPHHIQVHRLRSVPSIYPRTSITERDKLGPIETRPLCTEYKSNHVTSISPVGRTVDLFSVQADSHIINPQAFEAISTITSSTKSRNFDQNCVNNLESVQQNIIPGSGSALLSSHGDVQLFSLQGCGYTENIGLQNIEFSDYNDSELVTELPSHLYDGLRFNCDYLDLMEYPTVDQGLFIA
ncbi:hypothetical protein HHK36_015737 [Tetracentron sinense]|uniref:Response regulatory domain-containing protein n=1 Tax=Tetracentron sinense TaxID=13715 RepID=A0A834Z6Q2_TETSI|nr:hypothetical protein HHK36_015737 [Tetracentron sinense]